MDPAATTVFRFSGEGVHLEFAGSEEFVAQQLERFQSIIRRAIGAAPEPASGGSASAQGGEPAPAATATGESLESWAAARAVRGGRGGIQDRIMLFIAYLQNVQGRREVNGADILWCYQQMGMEKPKNLSNALGVLKRSNKYLDEGSRRGFYTLSAEGRRFVEARFR